MRNSLFLDIENAVRCIKDGKEYNPGIVWREHCKEFTCMKNGEILVKNVGCKEICVLKESKMAQCCPICKRKISCNPREIKIEIPRPMLRNKDLLVLSLSDPKCKPIVNKTHVTFRTKLAACRTKFKKTRKGFVYTNTVKKSYSVIVRPLFKFSCLLTVKQAHSNILASFKVNRPIVHSMRMVYTDSSGKALEKSPTNKEVMEGQPVFVQIVVDEKLQPDRYLVLERCQILSINRKKAYPLLESGYGYFLILFLVLLSIDFSSVSFYRVTRCMMPFLTAFLPIYRIISRKCLILNKTCSRCQGIIKDCTKSIFILFYHALFSASGQLIWFTNWKLFGLSFPGIVQLSM